MANDLISGVTQRISQMQAEQGFQLPENYSASNALNAAYLMLDDSSKGPSFIQKMNSNQIDASTVAQALLNMVIQGLSPAKNQGYFIQYGKSLSFSRSYFGAIAIVERQQDIDGKPYANIVHEGDTFEIGAEDDRTIVTKFEPKFENQDKPIVAAFAVIKFKDGHKEYTVMTKKEIDTAWSHRSNKGAVQQEFPQEMAKRTVLNRAAKFVINTSSDNDLLIKSINDTTNSEYDFDRKDVTPEADKAKRLAASFRSQANATDEPVSDSKAEPEEEPTEQVKTVTEPKEEVKPVDSKPVVDKISKAQHEAIQQDILESFNAK